MFSDDLLTQYKILPRLGGMTETRKKLALLSCLLTIILAILDQNIVSAAAVPIVRDLDPVHGLTRLPWLISAYALAATAALPLYGKLCDVYGARRVYLAALGTFLAGSALCGLAHDMGQLIAFRAVQGAGGGGLMSVTMVVIAQVAGPDRRGRGGGISGLVAGLAMVVGPLAGGLLVDHAGWRWIFYVNLPLGVLVLATAAVVLRLPVPGNRHRIDYPGAALAAAGAVVLLLITERYRDGAATVTWLGALAVLLIGLFVWRERTAAEPILPLSLFADPTVRVALPLQFITGAAMLGSIVYVMVYLQVARGVPATAAGLYLIPMAAGMSASGLLSGRLLDRGWSARTFLVGGTVCATAGIGLLGFLGTDTSRWMLGTDLFLLGAGLGQLLGLLIVVVQRAAPAGQLGVATTAVRFAQTLGSAFGAALFGMVLSRAFAAHAPAGGVAALPSLPPEARRVALRAFVDAVDTVFLSAAGVMVVAVVLATLIRDRSGDHLADRVPGVAVVPGPRHVPQHPDGGVEVRV
jgi:EmrB/QacA subfamily drug resistance transporter